MLDSQIALQWGAEPRFLHTVQQWTWCRQSLPMLMQRLTTIDTIFAGTATVDLAELGKAFWPWAATLEATKPLEPLDPIDYAHFCVGALLAGLVQQRPLRSPAASRGEEISVLTDTALTLLAAWRHALHADPLADDLMECGAGLWSSYIENVCEDSSQAIVFLDIFTGRVPVERFHTLMSERPSFKAALKRSRAPAA